jgi:HPr kinase/phosphorylase
MKKQNKPQEQSIIKPKTISYITVEKFYKELEDRLKLKLVTPEVSLSHRIRSTDIHRPGLAFSGYFDYFACDSVQILGQTEINYFETLSPEQVENNITRLFTYKIPCLVVSRNQKVPPRLIKKAVAANVPIFKSPLTTSKLSAQITVFLEEARSSEISLHATFVDVYGIGVLLLGKSGVGKSECALELIERGHRLVADDVTELKLRVGSRVMGYSSDIIGHHMEIRGLGIINILDIFGVGSVRSQKGVNLVVTLEKWNSKREYERLGIWEQTYELLGVKLPHLVIPVRPGRNIPILIEVAALTEREKRMGINPAQEFNKRLIQVMANNEQQPEGKEDSEIL